MDGQLKIFVDAGFLPNSQNLSEVTHSAFRKAGLGVWIPAIGTGVSLNAYALENNEAETLAILLGLLVGTLMNLKNTLVITDSRLNFERLYSGSKLTGPIYTVKEILEQNKVTLEWRPRCETSLADFFATLALSGKNLIAKTSNGKNAADKFRPLLHLERINKTPVKDVNVTWLTVPSSPKTRFLIEDTSLAQFSTSLETLLGERIPLAEFRRLVDIFEQRQLAPNSNSKNA